MALVLLTTTTTNELYHNISMCVNRAQKIFADAGSSRPNCYVSKEWMIQLLCASEFSINPLFASMQAIIDPDKQLSLSLFSPPMCGLLFGVNGWNLLNDHLHPGSIRV